MQKIIKTLYLLLLLLFLSACTEKNNPQAFYTWKGIGPDKWASIWLINRYIDPKAMIKLTAVNGTIEKAIAFDIPPANYKRTSKGSTIAMLAAAYPQASNKQTIETIIQIIHDIEVIAWGKPTHPRSALIEIAYRDLQRLYGRDRVPAACYLAFFDQLETALLKDNATQSITQFQQAITPNARCATQKTSFEQVRDQKQLVQELPIKKILHMMQQGKQVIFVDARELGEYQEYHIPNAVNMPLRQVNAESAQQFVDADLVVAYCLKDFRGFEVAKALKQRAGIKQAVIMNPYGINGWKALGLPTVGSRALSKIKAKEKLQACLSDLDHCLPSSAVKSK